MVLNEARNRHKQKITKFIVALYNKFENRRINELIHI